MARPVRVFPAYTQGPRELYAPKALVTQPSARPRPVVDQGRRVMRERDRCRAFPRVDSASVRAPLLPPVALPATTAMADGAWFLSPAVVAVALAAIPPLGVPLLWASPRFSVLAKMAVTVFEAFIVLVTVACAFAALR